MALNLDERYPGRANGKTLSYPQGSFKNRTSPTAKDGTYLEQDWANDWAAFFQSLIKDAGITPNNAVDTVEASQYFDALILTIQNRFPRFATYAEVATLTEDEGPIIVTDRGGLVWQWEDTAFFNGYRSPFSGKLEFGWTPTPLPWQVEAIGNTLNETDHGGVIARFRESGLTVALGSWVAGEYKIADMGGGEWKAPDMRDMFLRFTGTDADTANARVLGSKQVDALKSHLHGLVPNLVGTDAATGNYAAGTNNFGVGNRNTFSTGGSETRPKNSAFLPVINL